MRRGPLRAEQVPVARSRSDRHGQLSEGSNQPSVWCCLDAELTDVRCCVTASGRCGPPPERPAGGPVGWPRRPAPPHHPRPASSGLERRWPDGAAAAVLCRPGGVDGARREVGPMLRGGTSRRIAPPSRRRRMAKPWPPTGFPPRTCPGCSPDVRVDSGCRRRHFEHRSRPGQGRRHRLGPSRTGWPGQIQSYSPGTTRSRRLPCATACGRDVGLGGPPTSHRLTGRWGRPGYQGMPAVGSAYRSDRRSKTSGGPARPAYGHHRSRCTGACSI
jgi:hypothetical protein